MYQIALDGPPGTGKSTLGKELAKELDIMYLDSGALYRAFALHCLKLKIDTENTAEVKKAIKEFDVKIEGGNVQLCGEDVSLEIRKQYVSDEVKFIAVNPFVREHITKICRELSSNHSVVMDGRDISTDVFPKARFKYFISADLETRAERRYKELLEKGEEPVFELIKKAIQDREKIEKTRSLAPLVKHPEAIEIDSSDKTVSEIVELIKADVKKYLKKNKNGKEI